METIENTISEFFEGKKNVVSVHIFGSHAKGSATDKSDIDCAVLFQKNSIPDVMSLIQMRESLSEILNADVDLVCLNTASPIIGMQIYKHGKLLIKKDIKQYAYFIMNLLTDYFDLKYLRKPLEDNILNRKYYG